MKHFIFVLVAFTIITASPRQALAVEKIANSSASLATDTLSGDPIATQEYAIKKITLKRVLGRYNSVLAEKADSFVQVSTKYDIDPYLLPSIAGLESYFAKYMIKGTYNAYGWGGGKIAFNSWDEGIDTIGKTLRERYYDRGAETVSDVGRIYAESPTWAVRVQYFMGQFYTEEARARQVLTLL